MTRIAIESVFQGVDSAVSKKTSADYFCIVTIGKSSDGRIFVLDVLRERGISFHNQVKTIIKKAVEFRPLKIGIEENSFQAFLSQELERLTLLPIIPITTIKDKVLRAQARSALFETHRVYVAHNMHSFISEFVMFSPDGSSEHDDIIDAFLFSLDVAEDASKTELQTEYFAPEFDII